MPVVVLLLPSLFALLHAERRLTVVLFALLGVTLMMWSGWLAGMLPAVLGAYAVIWRWL